MSRPCDWSALGLGSDPIPGDPGTVATAARKYRSTADAVADASVNLGRLDMSENKSLGLTTILDQIKAVRTQLDDVESRVDGAAAALEYYGPRLGEAQQLSLQALSEAESARSSARASQIARDDAANEYYGTNDPARRESLKERYNSYNREVEHANSELGLARDKLRTAIEQRDDAARIATDSLKSIDQSSPVHDTFLDLFHDFVNKFLDFWDEYVGPWLDKVCDILDVVSLVLTVVAALLALTGVGGGAAAVLYGIAKGLSVVTAIAKGVKLAVSGLKAIEGRATWGEVGKDALMFGVGLLLAKGVKFTSTKLVAKQFSKSTVTISTLEKVVKRGGYEFSVEATKKAIDVPLGKIKDLARDALGHDSAGAGTPAMDTYRMQYCGVAA